MINPAPNEPPIIRTADDRNLHPGDRAFNYYDQKRGTIGLDLDSQGWFTFTHDDGTSTLLNGERICTEEFAKANSRRWPD